MYGNDLKVKKLNSTLKSTGAYSRSGLKTQGGAGDRDLFNSSFISVGGKSQGKIKGNDQYGGHNMFHDIN
jgi:hypothetical protein